MGKTSPQTIKEFELREKICRMKMLAEKLHHILEDITDDYFYKYDSNEPRDKFAIIAEHKRHAVYADMARECVFDMLKESRT